LSKHSLTYLPGFSIYRRLNKKGRREGKKRKTLSTRGVCESHCDLAILHLKSILRQKKNHGNSNISPCKNILFKKSSLTKNKIK
jgi:hypothetical protein